MSGPADGDRGQDALADYMRALQKLNGSKQSSATAADTSPGPGDPGAAAVSTSEFSVDPKSDTGPQAIDAPETSASDQTAPDGDDSLSRYLQAVNKAKERRTVSNNPKRGESAQESPSRASLEAARSALKAETVDSQATSAADAGGRRAPLRRGVERLRERGTQPSSTKAKKSPRRIPAASEEIPEANSSLGPEAPAAPEPKGFLARRKAKRASKPKQKASAKPKVAARQASVSAAPFNASPRTVKIGALLICVGFGLLLQRLVYYLAGLPYALSDMAVGATIALPVLLILVLVQAQSRSDWTALLASVAAIAVTGGLGIALGVSLLYDNAVAMHESGYVMQLVVHLSILTMIWGPVFLTVAGLLHRMELLKLSDSLEF